MNVLNFLKPYRFRPTGTQQDFDDVEWQVRNVPGAAALATTLGLGPLLAYSLTLTLHPPVINPLKESSMSIFSSILAKIFPSSHPSVTTAGAPPNAAPPSATAAAPAPAVPLPQVDVEQVLSGLASSNPEKLNWRTSIVDLMKLLKLDSSLGARKSLATELHFSGDMNDSAAMNVWLHKQVMTKLAQNGGKVPNDLKD